MTAAGFRLLNERLEAQYVAATLKHKDNAENEKILFYMKDTVELIVDHAADNLPYLFEWAVKDATAERRTEALLNEIPPPTPSPTHEMGVSVSLMTLIIAGVNSDQKVPIVTSSVVAPEPSEGLPTNKSCRQSPKASYQGSSLTIYKSDSLPQ